MIGFSGKAIMWCIFIEHLLHVKVNHTCNPFSSQTLNEYIRTLHIIQAPPHPPTQPYLVHFYLYIHDTSIFM